MMSIMAIVSLISGLIPIATEIGHLWENSAGFGAIATAIMKSPALKALEEFGASLFPSADKKIQAVLAAIHLGYPESTKWVQTSLNAIEKTGFIKFGDPLVVDGQFGPKTFAAVVVLQAKLGLHVTGAVAEVEYTAINKLIKPAA
jgi:peptidoglycan hydrolase-like protein with peptidoglycan-binding domain